MPEIIIFEEIHLGKIVHARYSSIQDADIRGSCHKSQQRQLSISLSQKKDKGSRGWLRGRILLEKLLSRQTLFKHQIP